MSLGNNISFLRKQKKLTQEQLADRMSVTRQTVSRWEAEDGKLIGYYSLLIQDNQECELNNLCVLPEYRHKKIGCRLLENAFENARNMNCTKNSYRYR